MKKARIFDGIATHWYDKGNYGQLTAAHKLFPDKFILATEVSTNLYILFQFSYLIYIFCLRIKLMCKCVFILKYNFALLEKIGVSPEREFKHGIEPETIIRSGFGTLLIKVRRKNIYVKSLVSRRD